MSQEIKYEIIKLGLTYLKNFYYSPTMQYDGAQRKLHPKLFYRVLANNEKVDHI